MHAVDRDRRRGGNEGHFEVKRAANGNIYTVTCRTLGLIVHVLNHASMYTNFEQGLHAFINELMWD